MSRYSAPQSKRSVWRVLSLLLLDHLHCVWTLPDGDADFSTRWMMIKRAVS